MKLLPLNKKVYLKINDEVESMKNGIHLGKQVINNRVAEVLAVAEDVEKVKVGDKVIYSPNTGMKIKQPFDDQEYQLVREEDLGAIILNGNSNQ